MERSNNGDKVDKWARKFAIANFFFYMSHGFPPRGINCIFSLALKTFFYLQISSNFSSHFRINRN